jgi:subtilisin family serine protease
LRYCLVCDTDLGKSLDDLYKGRGAKPAEGYLAKTWWSLLNLLVRAWYRLRCFLTTSKRGRQMNVQMDAYLIRDYWRAQKHGIRKFATSSMEADETAVIAKVYNVKEFEDQVNKQNGRITTKINGKADKTALDFQFQAPLAYQADDNTTIVTARIRGDINEIERLRQMDCVKSLKAARRVRPFLEKTKQEAFSCAELLPGLLPVNHNAKGDNGVIIGIVDFGLDFAHRNFQYLDEDGNARTRILALWDQKAVCDKTHSPEKFQYGRLFEKPRIDDALQQEDPYKALGYDVPKNSLFETGAHGTYVTDVAAGNGEGSNCSGIAPQADIVFVDVSAAGRLMDGPQSAGSTFSQLVQVLEAVDFIFDYAKDRNRPCVVNISLGTNDGPHDGTTLLEQALDRLVTQEPNRAVVIAAGNSFGKKLHVTGRVPEGGCVDLKWHIPRFDSTDNNLEIWYAGEDRFSLELLNPCGKLVAKVRPREVWGTPRGCTDRMLVVNRLDDPNNGDNTINLFFERGVTPGDWTLRLRGDIVHDGNFHAWIERDDQGQSRFVNSLDESYEISNEYTLSSIANGRETIVVSSYNAYKADLPLSDSSSSGPTRDKDLREQRQWQPTISAPGEEVLAAQSGTVVLRHRQSGTSLAAPVVTGAVALMLTRAQERGINLTACEIRKILIRTAHRNPPVGSGWDAGFGFGRICASLAMADVGVGFGDEILDRHRQQAQKDCISQELVYYV